MQLPKYTSMNFFSIWTRRYHDNRVLLAAHKIGQHNKVVFTKDPGMGTEPYYISGKTVKKYPKTSNGKISVYEVPVDEFEPLELTRDIREIL